MEGYKGTQVPPYPPFYRGNTQGIPDLYSLLILALLAKLPGPPAPAPPAARAFRQRSRAQQGGSGWLGAWEHLVNLCFFHHKPRWMFFCCFKMGVSWDNGIHDAGGPHIAKLVNITNYDL